MLARGFRFDHCDPNVTPHVFIFGLFLAYFTIFYHVHANSGRCKSTDIALKYQHCGTSPGGVHDLDCFGNYSQGFRIKYYCVWKPGNYASVKTHTLVIQQSTKYCVDYSKITDTSTPIKLFERHNMTAEVFENGHLPNCTKADFKGSPKSLWRCGPPNNVSFSRHAGRLFVSVNWQQVNVQAVKHYSVRYKAQGSLQWNQPPVQSENQSTCTVEDVNPSLAYTAQIRCIRNRLCSQCVWSDAFNVPPALTATPVVVNSEEVAAAEGSGSRIFSLTWKFPVKTLHDGYYVSVGKASGEAPWERISTTHPESKLILSYSAYQLEIRAFNNVSSSPALERIIPQREDGLNMRAGKLNVTVHSNTSFTIYWKDNLITNYVCYSAEWMKKGHKAAYKSFYQNRHNYRKLSFPEPLEPFKRYSITLHTRPNKDTCNMKRINNSESTYGTTQFYFIEGSPVSAPTNITSYNVTLNSVALRWSSIPEEDIRGFLLGYTLYYTEYHQGTGREKNMTVDPLLNSCQLEELKSGTVYEVQMSGFTQMGEGARSKAILVTTIQQHEGFSVSGIITGLAVLTIVLLFGPPIIKRGKRILWPTIPNPENSNTMQKLERPDELELLGSIKTLKVEERDTDSLQIVEKEQASAACTSASVALLLQVTEDDGDSAFCKWAQEDTEDVPGDTLTDVQQTDLHAAPLAFASGYTTMETFRQAMAQEVPLTT